MPTISSAAAAAAARDRKSGWPRRRLKIVAAFRETALFCLVFATNIGPSATLARTTTFRFGENQMHRLTVYTVVGGGLGLGNAWGITRKLFRADRFSRRHDRLHLHSCRLKNAPTDSGHYSRLLHIARWNIEHHTKFIVSPGRRGTDLRPLSRRFAVLSLKFSLDFPFFPLFFTSSFSFFPSFVSFYPFQSSTRVDTLLLSTADDFIGIEGSAQGVSWRFRPFLYSFYPRVLLNTPPPVDETHSKGNSGLRHRYLENIWMRGKENGKAVWLREFTACALHYNDL